MILTWKFEEIGSKNQHWLEVDFDVAVSGGSSGSYWEPPEPPEVEIHSVSILGCSIEFSESWEGFLEDVAIELAEGRIDHIEDAAIDMAEGWADSINDDYYEQIRDERRGC